MFVGIGTDYNTCLNIAQKNMLQLNTGCKDVQICIVLNVITIIFHLLLGVCVCEGAVMVCFT